MGCCNVTKFGCCPDGMKPATGPDEEGTATCLLTTRIYYNRVDDYDSIKSFDPCNDYRLRGNSCQSRNRKIRDTYRTGRLYEHHLRMLPGWSFYCDWFELRGMRCNQRTELHRVVLRMLSRQHFPRFVRKSTLRLKYRENSR